LEVEDAVVEDGFDVLGQAARVGIEEKGVAGVVLGQAGQQRFNGTLAVQAHVDRDARAPPPAERCEPVGQKAVQLERDRAVRRRVRHRPRTPCR
jgi:hypothetical protein